MSVKSKAQQDNQFDFFWGGIVARSRSGESLVVCTEEPRTRRGETTLAQRCAIHAGRNGSHCQSVRQPTDLLWVRGHEETALGQETADRGYTLPARVI